VTNCGPADDVTITVTDGQGWCAPLNQVLAVPAGADTCVMVSCTVPDSCGGAFTDVAFSAVAAGGASVQCTTRVTTESCGPILVLEPSSITFGTIAYGDTLCDSVCVINTGDAVLTVGSVTGCGTGGFFTDQTGFNTSIAPGDTSKFLVCFSPVPAGEDTCSVSVSSDGGNGLVTVQVSGVTAVGGPSPGRSMVLSAVVPTPFSASAQIGFTLPEADRVTVTVFDLQGRQLRNLAESVYLGVGSHALAWDGRDARGSTVAEGIYFVRVATEHHGAKVTRAIRLDR
jgi:hypothetical protein